MLFSCLHLLEEQKDSLLTVRAGEEGKKHNRTYLILIFRKKQQNRLKKFKEVLNSQVTKKFKFCCS